MIDELCARNFLPVRFIYEPPNQPFYKPRVNDPPIRAAFETGGGFKPFLRSVAEPNGWIAPRTVSCQRG